MSVRSTLIVLLIAVTMIVPAGMLLGMYGNSEASPGSSILRIGFDQPIESLNPYLGYSDASWIFYSLVYETLQGVGGDLKPVPGLAKEWRVVPEELPYGSVWEYNISSVAEWSDGVPVTSADVVYTINMNSDPGTYDAMWSYQPYSRNIHFALAIDDDTVQIHFWNRDTETPMPVAYGDSILIPILPKHVLETMNPFEISFSWDGTPVIGSGPFIPTPTLYDDWIAGDMITLLRNPGYHGGADFGWYVQFDKIEMHFYDDPVAMCTALENNELDVTNLPIDVYKDLKNRVDLGLVPNVETYDGPRPDSYWVNVLVNMNIGGFNPSRLDPVIRQAMAMATNKSYIVEQFYQNEGSPGSTLISPVSDWHYELGLGEEYVYDLVAANTLLQSAGYVDIDSDGIRECTSSSWAYQQGYVSLNAELEYELLIRLGFPEELQTGQFLESEWAQIGIDLQLSIVEESAMSMRVYSYNYDLAIWYWSMDPDPNYILFTQTTAAWGGWSDTKYGSPEFEENYSASIMEMDPVVRHAYVDNCQMIHYRDAPYIILVNTNDTYAWRTDTFSNWGDWDAYPGRSVTAYWTGNPLYFELVPQVEYNAPPQDVHLYADPWYCPVGDPVTLTVNAMDPDGDDLSIYIDFGDGTSDQAMSSAPMYATHEVTFTHTYTGPALGYDAVVWVDDGSGAPGCNVSVSVHITMMAPSDRSVSYHWYDLFNVPTLEFWNTRWDVYAIDMPLTSSYPFLFRTYGYPEGNDWLSSSMRLDVTAQYLPEISMNGTPEFLPKFGTEDGGVAYIDWYMQYMVSSDYPRYSGMIPIIDDGWLNILNGTVTLDRQASKAVMGLTDTDFDNFASWWAANGANFTQEYMDWLEYEGNDRLDIYNMYDYVLTIIYFGLDAQRVGETVVLSYDTVCWGMECLMARWLHEAFLPVEYFYEDFSMQALIGPDDANIDIQTAVEYAAYAGETTLVPGGEPYGQPCWQWEAMLGDYIASTPQFPSSDFDPYEGLTYYCQSPANAFWHTYLPYDYTPSAWNLLAGESLELDWPSGDQLFYVHNDSAPLDPDEVTGPMTVLYSEPMEMDFPGQVVNDQASGALIFTGPIDLLAWSQTQFKHEALASDWDRLSVLPWGMPYIEFQLDSGLNTPPTAFFGYDPELGDIYTTYSFEAYDSWDLEDPMDSLEVRWDWNGDGTYDTGWSADKTVTHQFTVPGLYNVTLQVRDSQGLMDTRVMQIIVVELIPEFPLFTIPMIAAAMLFFISRVRRRRG